jgi:hypothetical protein
MVVFVHAVEQMNEVWVHELNGNVEARIRGGWAEGISTNHVWGNTKTSADHSKVQCSDLGKGRGRRNRHLSALPPWTSRLSISGTLER